MLAHVHSLCLTHMGVDTHIGDLAKWTNVGSPDFGTQEILVLKIRIFVRPTNSRQMFARQKFK